MKKRWNNNKVIDRASPVRLKEREKKNKVVPRNRIFVVDLLLLLLLLLLFS